MSRIGLFGPLSTLPSTNLDSTTDAPRPEPDRIDVERKRADWDAFGVIPYAIQAQLAKPPDLSGWIPRLELAIAQGRDRVKRLVGEMPWRNEDTRAVLEALRVELEKMAIDEPRREELIAAVRDALEQR